MPLLLTKLSFWLSLAILFYTFVGYPLLIFCLAYFSDAWDLPPVPPTLPTVTVILAAHNEETRIAARLQNLLATDYPADKLQIIVVSDGSTDATVPHIKALSEPRIQLILQPHRRGKAHALNLAVAAALSDLIVFTDVRQRFATDTVAQLAKHFNDLQTGAVSGELLIESAASATGGGVDIYRRLEKMIRRAEARWDSSIGCTGAVYAIRRAYFQPLPADTILDDVVIPMQIALQGYRVGFEPAARAFDPQTLEPAREQVRKRRTIAGNFQMLFRHPAWLLPWHNRLWGQLLSHKYLRLTAPLFLVSTAAANLLLLTHRFYWLPFLGQCLFYGLAIYGLRHTAKKSRWFSVPAGFVFLNWMTVDGLRHHLRGTYRHGQWPDAVPQPR